MSRWEVHLARKPVGLLLGAGAGPGATMLLKQMWTLIRRDAMPDATDEDRSWGEVLAAAALRGAIFSAAKAATERKVSPR
ncbi:DUF4235 domain-containing protein [Dactylosporangium aurantiacum]|uniref:DUF4235 domain-containing protein n=1 Tax=Dactylosporangium aurantiacum TaxID=35754 RepID=A0A9Q9ITC4_9ACTN|nr:DUF4235 domain-containing protein [Dactylosporangium aurantiacum]MDG6110415.1 DUF4235 domain-containing protein [Dactylosporangium aurantiacum]UWZ58588.1 DUF4235 domain-containing protein [Dactylosporangium aurantiacum]